MRYTVGVYDRGGVREEHECATREEALALAARLRRQRGAHDYSVVVMDNERDGREVTDEDDEP